MDGHTGEVYVAELRWHAVQQHRSSVAVQLTRDDGNPQYHELSLQGNGRHVVTAHTQPVSRQDGLEWDWRGSVSCQATQEMNSTQLTA